MKILKIVLLFLFVLVLSGNVFAQELSQLYSQAVGYSKEGNYSFAFMNYSAILRDYPGSKYAETALFAVGEYDYIYGNYSDAVTVLLEFVSQYPDSKAKVFALAYLYSIAERQQEETVLENLKNEIVGLQRLSLLFKNSKQFKFRSPLLRNHKVVYYIDKVDFFVEGELFAEIKY